MVHPSDSAEALGVERDPNRALQQDAVAVLGRLALEGAPLERLLPEAARRVVEVLGVTGCRILEALPNGSGRVVRASAGLPASDDEGTGACVDIEGHGQCYGLLCVQAEPPPGQQVMGFLRSVASLLAAAVHRLRTEEALRRSERLLHESQRIAHLGSWNWDIVANTLEWSPEIYRIFGLAPAEFGATYEAFLGSVHPEDRQAVQQAVTDALERAVPYSIEHRVVRPDGEERVVHERAEVFRDAHGTAIRMAGTVHDVTDQRQLEARLRNLHGLEVMAQLAGATAHDFNNLLGGILLETELLQDAIPDEDPLRSHVDGIGGAVARGAALIRQLLAFSRTERGGSASLDLRGALADLEPTLCRLVGSGIEVRVETGEAPLWVPLDQGQLHQALVHLVVNARDAMPEGGLLEVRAESAGGRVRLSVRDTGTGMSHEVRTRAFEPFFSTKSRQQNRGLGMPRVRDIAHEAGGRVDLQSEVGLGTTVTLDLPAGAEPAAPPPTPVPADVAGRGETILLVKDEESLRALARRFLTRLGYTVLEARDGLEALRLAAEHPVDLLVSDLHLPGLGAVEIIEGLRRLHPGARALVVAGYFPSGNGGSALPPDVARLQRPYPTAALARVVRDLLDGIRAGAPAIVD